MTVKASMESYAARLASFNVAHPLTKKRTSDARGAKSLKWSHKSPSPPELARAGFFYQPTSSCPDNTTCYLCQSQIDGWEANDDAVEEHLRLSPNCGWAIIVAIEQDIENGGHSPEDPMSEKVSNARRMTFGSAWPHEHKRGWVCKIQKMIEAGWHYCPTVDSDDFVKCSYCNLSLDGWEPKDNPFDEHQRRSPECTFFTLSASVKGKSGRSKKGRASKASRLSTQSNFTTVSEGPSVVELEQNPDDTIMSNIESTKPAKPAKEKATGKVKKAAGKAKGKGSRAKQEESQIASSFLEAEDDNFEVKVTPSPAPISSSKKRKSGDISIVDESQKILQAEMEDSKPQGPAKRQRRTRASSAVMQAHEKPITVPTDEAEVDARMTDAEEMPPPSAPISKKKGRGGKKRGSSVARKASNASIASKASLRAKVPDDNDIDAALEAELDRPLTDEEDKAEAEQPRTRRLTRNKPWSKKDTASVAPTRRGTRANSVSVVDSSTRDPDPTIQSIPPEENARYSEIRANDAHVSEADELPPNTKRPEGKRSSKSPQLQMERRDNLRPSQESEAIPDGDQAQRPKQLTKSRQKRGAQASQPLSTRNTRTSNMAPTNVTVDQTSDTNSSMLDTQTVQDDSGHETDASVMKQSRTGRGVRKAGAPAKKAKKGKKAAKTSQNIQDVAQEPTMEVPIDQSEKETPNKPSVSGEGVEPTVTVAESAKEQSEETKVTKPSKAKGKATKAKTAPKKIMVIASPEQPDAVVEIHDTPVSLPPPSMHSTPRPALSTQSSDVENQPPSSRPSSFRPPLAIQSPSKSQVTKVPLAVTPTMSPSKSSFSKLQSTFPWTAVDLESIFRGTPPANKENDPFVLGKTIGEGKGALTSPEKKLTVEEWIQFNAQRGEERLRNECERLVGKFEGEGVRALRTLEGIVCAP